MDPAVVDRLRAGSIPPIVEKAPRHKGRTMSSTSCRISLLVVNRRNLRLRSISLRRLIDIQWFYYDSLTRCSRLLSKQEFFGGFRSLRSCWPAAQLQAGYGPCWPSAFKSKIASAQRPCGRATRILQFTDPSLVLLSLLSRSLTHTCYILYFQEEGRRDEGHVDRRDDLGHYGPADESHGAWAHYEPEVRVVRRQRHFCPSRRTTTRLIRELSSYWSRYTRSPSR